MGANEQNFVPLGTTRSIVSDYIYWRLHRMPLTETNNNLNLNFLSIEHQPLSLSLLTNDSSSSAEVQQQRLYAKIRQIAYDSELSFLTQQTAAAASANIIDDSQILTTPTQIYDKYFRISREIFSDGIINWGRIITLISYSGLLAVQCCEQNMLTTIKSIIDWTVQFIDNDLKQWLDSQKYWDGFLKIYDKPQSNRRHSLSRVASILGTIGVITTIGAFYMRRT